MADIDNNFSIDDILSEFHKDTEAQGSHVSSPTVAADQGHHTGSGEAAIPGSEKTSSTADAVPLPPMGKAGGKGSLKELALLPLKLVLIAASLLVLYWMVKNVHPATATVRTENVKVHEDLSGRFEVLANNLAGDALSDITYIRKKYTIPENDASGPVPDSTKFGETDDPAVIRSVIDSASDLLEGQEMVWNEALPFAPGTTMQYYCDDSILVIAWIELQGNTQIAFSEVKLADSSQIRRALAGGEYSSSIQLKASDMAKTANAVIAINGDFYAFRQPGVVVYKRELYRFEPKQLDTCFFTGDGQMLFSYAGELTTEEEANALIAENDVLFSVSFGPVLVDNGELKVITSYPVGEFDTIYARAAIGMTDTLHYVLMATDTEDGLLNGFTINRSAELMYEKGCVNAYSLDGGQTATIVMNGEPFNGIVYGSERVMSDILYFATAIPSKEASQ